MEDTEIFSKIGASKGVQNKPPQNVPVWHVGYFELKAVWPSRLRDSSCPFTDQCVLFGKGAAVILRDWFLSLPAIYLAQVRCMNYTSQRHKG